jgi:hypothetical protein
MINHHGGFRQKKRAARSTAGSKEKIPPKKMVPTEIVLSPVLGVVFPGSVFAGFQQV